MNLHGTVTLITGAKRIGAVVAAELARGGSSVAFSYGRSQREAEAAADGVRAHGARAAVFKADLSDANACTALVEQTVGELGRLDVLINMASMYVKRPFAALTVEDWDANLAVDLRAAFVCSKAAVPHMRRHGRGRIVNISDWVARSGRPRYHGYVPYYVAKAGVIALTEALALELAADNILVNAVAPGPILAPPGTSPEESAAIEQATPLGRWGGAMEIAKAILTFIDSDFITGETIRVDGGRHLQ